MRRAFPHFLKQHLSILRIDSSDTDVEYTQAIDQQLCEIESNSSQGAMKLTSVRTPQWRSRYDGFVLNSGVAADNRGQPNSESIFLVLDEENDDKVVAVQSIVFSDMVIGNESENSDPIQIREGYMLDLRVSSEYQRMGIASRLKQCALEYLLYESDTDLVSLGMVRDNYPSHRVFQKGADHCNIDYVCDNMIAYLIAKTDTDTDDQLKQDNNLVVEVLHRESDVKQFFDQHLASQFILYPTESSLDALIAFEGFKAVYIAYDKDNPDEFISFGVYDKSSRLHWVFVNPESESEERERFEFNYVFGYMNTFQYSLDSERLTQLLQVLFNRIVEDCDGRSVAWFCSESKPEHRLQPVQEVVSNNLNSTLIWEGCEYFADVSNNNQELFDLIKETIHSAEKSKTIWVDPRKV